jgi:hypothetical protein
VPNLSEPPGLWGKRFVDVLGSRRFDSMKPLVARHKFPIRLSVTLGPISLRKYFSADEIIVSN